MAYAATLASVQEAAARIQGHVIRTPVMTCSTLSRLSGHKLFFKCENFQKGGAFKIRGATNALFSVDAATAARGVVTHSSGNHAQACALAARARGVPAHIVMPSTAPQVKKNAVRGYGARKTRSGREAPWPRTYIGPHRSDLYCRFSRRRESAPLAVY